MRVQKRCVGYGSFFVSPFSTFLSWSPLLLPREYNIECLEHLRKMHECTFYSSHACLDKEWKLFTFYKLHQLNNANHEMNLLNIINS
jgi:hypothetical protein